MYGKDIKVFSGHYNKNGKKYLRVLNLPISNIPNSGHTLNSGQNV